MKYGVVQGRLVPQVGDFIQRFPEKDYLNEFDLASQVGCDHIEWILTNRWELQYGDCNPLMKFGRHDVGYLRQKFNVGISAVCMDTFLGNKDGFHIENHRLVFEELINTCQTLGIKRIVLPFLEEASIRLPFKRDEVLNSLAYILKPLNHNDIDFSIETDMYPDEVLDTLEVMNEFCKASVTLDTGNLTRIGHDIDDHIKTYGERISNIHIKDAFRGGTSVPLGTGDLDLGVISKAIETSGVDRVTFQTARIPGVTDVDVFIRNRKIVEDLLNEND